MKWWRKKFDNPFLYAAWIDGMKNGIYMGIALGLIIGLLMALML